MMDWMNQSQRKTELNRASILDKTLHNKRIAWHAIHWIEWLTRVISQTQRKWVNP